jgi:hypothetical protein
MKMEIIRIEDELPDCPCLAWDDEGGSWGTWDGGTFDSITETYSFDSEFEYDGFIFYGADGTVCGNITHWMPVPPNPHEEV